MLVWPTYPDGVGFLLGDFNIPEPEEGRINTRAQTFSECDTIRAAAAHAAFSMNLAKAPLVPCHASTGSWLAFRWPS